MSSRRKEKDARKRQRNPVYPIPSEQEQARFAEATHRAVSEVSGTDGFERCLYYAVAGYALLADQGWTIQVGEMVIVADPVKGLGNGGGVIFGMAKDVWNGDYHAWLGRDNGSKIEIVDFTSRHYRQYCETANGNPAQWNRPDPPMWLWNATGKQSDLVKFCPNQQMTSDAFAKLNGSLALHVELLADSAKRHYRELLSQQAA
jgi:hypothetical protein